jgi:uncharacterized protein YkwD
MGICNSTKNNSTTETKKATGVAVTVKHEVITLTPFEKDSLDEHNRLRALHGIPALKYDPELAKYSQNWADKLAKTGSFEHSTCRMGNKMIGENIAMVGGEAMTGKMATVMWYDEINDYNFNRPGFSGTTGHFTQVVWKTTEFVGVGVAMKGDETYVVANYFPPGNFNNDYAKNVFPPKHK